MIGYESIGSVHIKCYHEDTHLALFNSVAISTENFSYQSTISQDHSVIKEATLGLYPFPDPEVYSSENALPVARQR